MPSPWINHVKQYAKDKNILHKKALKKGNPSFKKS
jgi:hypothetical protein